MNTGKSVRRYSRWKYSAKWGKYFAHWGVAIPVAVALVMGFMGGMTGLLYLLVELLDWAFLSSEEFLDNTWSERIHRQAYLLTLIGLMGILLTLRLLFRNLLYFMEKEDEDGHFLNPLPPEENPLLTEEELLVRASVPTPEVQHAVLLRVATTTAEIPPEQLLRTANDRG